MSKFEAFMMACIAVCLLIAFGLIVFCIIMVLSVMKPIGWIVLGIVALVTLVLWIGIYQYDKHF
ncbi:putative membrane-bound protein [Enterococcus phage G01]|nr:putative membrane-bound protein [Enterococcus phage G01]